MEIPITLAKERQTKKNPKRMMKSNQKKRGPRAKIKSSNHRMRNSPLTKRSSTNLNKKRGEDALPAQRKRLDAILDKGNDLVKKCESNRFWKYQSVDEEERSFLKDELMWLL